MGRVVRNERRLLIDSTEASVCTDAALVEGGVTEVAQMKTMTLETSRTGWVATVEKLRVRKSAIYASASTTGYSH